MKNEIILFDNQNVKLEVNLKDETVWLSLEQMSNLFGRDKSVISRHIRNILQEELKNLVVIAKFATTTKHGAINKKTQTHFVDYYNLDVIISVGYRVKSQNGIVFRRWANSILKDHLIKGYTLNKKRLEYLEKTVKLIDIATRIKNNDTKDVLNVINNYTKALNLLDDYDHLQLKKPIGSKNTKQISYKECLDIIKTLKFDNNSYLFALERNNGLEEILGAIYQTFDTKDVYPTIQEKAANLLYMIVKNHVFIDGNKRIAAALFIYFLQTYNILIKNNKQIIDNNTLAALTLLIAEPNPKEKEILINLILNFLNN